MRKDVRIGAAFGCFFVVLIVIYAAVFSKGHSDKKKDQLALEQGKGDIAKPGEGAAPVGEDPLAALTHLPMPADANTPASPGAVPAHGDDAQPAAPAPAPVQNSDSHSATNWPALLSAEHVEDVAPARTRTPSGVPAEGGNASAPAPASPQSTPETPTQNPPANPADSNTAGALTSHRVAEGETLSSIARAVYGNAKYYIEIAKANPKLDSAHLKPGTVIVLPDKSQLRAESAPSTPTTAGSDATERRSTNTAFPAVNTATQYRVQSADSLYSISVKLYHTPNKMDAIYQLNKTAIGPDQAKLKLNMVLQLPEPPLQTASR